jgi:hypothetical protein
LRDPIVYCADIGSVKAGRFGWARGRPGSVEFLRSDSIRELVQAVAADLSNGEIVALGFEAPLFVPLPEDPVELTRARRGEGHRPWSAGAGCGALAVGTTEVPWILREVRTSLGHSPPCLLRWDGVPDAGPALFLWEAFVSAGAKAPRDRHGHTGDAEVAVRAFLGALPDLNAANAIVECEVHSLIGAAILRSGWTDDLDLLAQPCVVIRGGERTLGVNHIATH